MNTKIILWIPIVGIILAGTGDYTDKDLGLDNPLTFFTSLMWQGVSTVLMLYLIFNIFLFV